MPVHDDFAKIKKAMLEEYGEEKGLQIYYSWLNKHGYDDTKPFEGQKSRAKESGPIAVFEKFEWTMPLRFYQGKDGLIIRGEAIHSGVTRNKNLYSKDELLRAARSLIGSRLQFINHDNWLGEGNEVLDAEYVGDKIEYVARVVDPKAIEAIKKGEINHVSIDSICRRCIAMNGVKACEGLILNGLCLVHRDDPAGPGDLKSSVEIWRECCPNQPESCKSGLETDFGVSLKMSEKTEIEQSTPAAVKEQAEAPVTGYGPVAGVPELSIEERVKALEEKIRSLEQTATKMFNDLNARLSTLIELQPAIAAEKSSRVAVESAQTQEKAAATGVGIVKPIGELPSKPPESGMISTREIDSIIADRKLFTPMLKLRAIMDLAESRRSQK